MTLSAPGLFGDKAFILQIFSGKNLVRDADQDNGLIKNILDKTEVKSS
jgi:hypothetical protein